MGACWFICLGAGSWVLREQALAPVTCPKEQYLGHVTKWWPSLPLPASELWPLGWVGRSESQEGWVGSTDPRQRVPSGCFQRQPGVGVCRGRLLCRPQAVKHPSLAGVPAGVRAASRSGLWSLEGRSQAILGCDFVLFPQVRLSCFILCPEERSCHCPRVGTHVSCLPSLWVGVDLSRTHLSVSKRSSCWVTCLPAELLDAAQPVGPSRLLQPCSSSPPHLLCTARPGIMLFSVGPACPCSAGPFLIPVGSPRAGLGPAPSATAAAKGTDALCVGWR